MKTLIFYYSRGGNTRALAHALAEETGADLRELCYQKPPGALGVFLRGCPAAIGQKPARLQPFDADIAGYDRVIVMAPVWAGHPAPPFNSLIDALPGGTALELRLVSAGGDTADGKARIVARVQAAGCTVADYMDNKAPHKTE